MTAEGEADYTTDPPSMAMSMEMPAMVEGGGEMEIRLVDGVMYMNMGQMTNDKFIKVDLSDPANLPPGMDTLTEQMDPLAAFEQFGPALTSVTYVGEEEVDGDATQHFTMVMDTSKIATFKDLPAGADVPKELVVRRVVRRRVPVPQADDGDGGGGHAGEDGDAGSPSGASRSRSRPRPRTRSSRRRRPAG